MAGTAIAADPQGWARIGGWRRLRLVLLASLVVSILVRPSWEGPWIVLLGRLLILGLLQLLVFGVLEHWPAKLPRWMARWGLQVVGVALAIPFGVALAYSLTTFGDPVPWPRNMERMAGFAMICALGLLLTPWIAMTALYRQISGQAQRQALAFDLQRSEYERHAAQTRLQLLQRQVEPHFLFNTLANVRELIESGSPQAAGVLDSLIAYLRAAVPRLQGEAGTLAQEMDLVRAYLRVMQMRMPDRLQFSLHGDEAALVLPFPAMMLLTLVENAVRHGIDPSETGGSIDVRVRLQDGRFRAEVIDTGVGLRPATAGTGTGLANLRERLHLAHGMAAQLRLLPMAPRGVCAELTFPAPAAA
jgi:hypothetical protein